jgi:hypothetical protein
MFDHFRHTNVLISGRRRFAVNYDLLLRKTITACNSKNFIHFTKSFLIPWLKVYKGMKEVGFSPT